MSLLRRDFLQNTALSFAAMGFMGTSALASSSSDFKISMCDWNVRDEKGKGGNCRPDLIPRAVEAHLRGLQVSVGTNPDNIPLREKAVRKRYLELCKEYDFTINSVAAGSILNSIPLASEPESAVYVIEAVEAASALGAKNILTAFFGRGDLKYKNYAGQTRKIQSSPTNIWELDQHGVDRVVAALKQNRATSRRSWSCYRP
jgi:sugar phosphate isomerase/epimerase